MTAPAVAAAATFASASLYVGDLMNDVTEAMLYEVFNTVGPVASIRVCRDNVTRRSLGYAYVNYHSASDAERALDTLNFSAVKNHPCRIMWSHRDPSVRRSAVGNIFVKNLDKSIDNKALFDTFSLFGNILSCKVAVDSEGKSRGFGFVHYETAEAAKTAIDRVNNMQIGSKTVMVCPFLKKTERSSGVGERYTNVYVNGMPETWTEKTLQEIFSKFGTVTSTALQQDKKNRPYGFVNFDTTEAAQSAVEGLNGCQCGASGVKGKDDVTGKDDTKEGEEEVPKLFVGRHQNKAERAAYLKQKFDGVSAEKRDKYAGVNLYIKNLDGQIDDEKLHEVFAPFGTITSAKIMRDDKGVSRGFGFVCFMSPEEATKAVTEMHLKLMNAKPLYVGLAEKREQRVQRLQHRYRMPNPRGPTDIMGPMGPAPIFPTHPPHMFFSPGPGRPGPMGMFPTPMGPMGWRGPGARGPFPGMVGPLGAPGPMGMRMIPAGTVGPVGPMGPMGYNPAMFGGMLPQGGMISDMFRGGLRGPARPTGPGTGPMGKSTSQGKRPQGYSYTAQARNLQVGAQTAPGLPAADAPTPIELTAAGLANATPQMQKQMLGERLFPRITALHPELAGKITGMMLEMDNSELLILLDSEPALKAKVDEAIRVLQQAAAVAGQ